MVPFREKAYTRSPEGAHTKLLLVLENDAFSVLSLGHFPVPLISGQRLLKGSIFEGFLGK